MEKSIRTSEQKKLRKLLRQVRKAAGFRQADLAKVLGKHQTFVSNYERGERTLDLLELRQVCHAVGLSLSEFVQRFEDSLR
jgi:transcriptional regulator with XRE-family HTH domain